MSPLKLVSTIILGSAIVLSTLSCAEQDSEAKTTIETRQANFKEIGKSFKTIRDELKGDADMAKIKAAADTIAADAKKIQPLFPEGTGPEAGVETEAKAEIWNDKATFNEAAKKLIAESAIFAELAATGDAEKINAGVRGLGGACKNCHDQFREEDE